MPSLCRKPESDDDDDDNNDYDDGVDCDDDDDGVEYDDYDDLMIIAVALAVHGNRIMMMKTMVLMIIMITDKLDDDSMMTV